MAKNMENEMETGVIYGFPKTRGTIFGAPMLRTIVFWESIVGSPYFRKLPIGVLFHPSINPKP